MAGSNCSAEKVLILEKTGTDKQTRARLCRHAYPLAPVKSGMEERIFRWIGFG